MMSTSETNYQELAERDYQEKTALKEKSIAYYKDKLAETGLSSTERLARYLPRPTHLLTRGIVFAHNEFEKIASAMVQNQPWAVVSGLNPSGPLHFGHKAVFDLLLWLQQQGASLIQIPMTNDETYVVGKASSLAESRRMAYEEVIPSIIAMGFDPKRTQIYVHSDYKDIYNLAMHLSKGLTYSKVKGVFGLEPSDNPGTIFYRGAVQLADILLPQLPEFGGPKLTLIPVGLDQHPYLLLARDVAPKFGMQPPAELIMKFLISLAGPDIKMSASHPESAIFLTDSPKEAQRKIQRAFTGGSPLASVQRERGGIPEICAVCSLLEYNFMTDHEWNLHYNRCVTGEILCGETKKIVSEYVADYLSEHQKAREQARSRLDEFILEAPLESLMDVGSNRA